MAGRPPFDQFSSEEEDIDSYLERLQEYFIAYDIKDGTEHAAKRRAILLTSIGSVSYRVLKDLSFPDAPNTKTFEQLATLLRGHYKPTRLKVAERYRFHSANQRPGESITDFVRELNKLAGTCEITNDQLQDSLRDRFICGLRSEQIKRKLLSANYTFQEAVDAAIAQETAQKDVQGLRSPAGVNKVKRDNLASRNRTYTTGRHNARNDKQMQPTGVTQRCFRCGLTNHSPDKCKYKDFECHRCNQKGHLRSECRNTKPPRPKAEGRQHVRLADQDAAGEAPEGGEDQFFESIFNLDGAQPSFSQNSGMATPAVKVPVLIEDTEFLMEVDTGAAASILSYSDYDQHFKYLALKPVQRSFHAYAGTPLDVAGQILVDVEHNGQRATLPLLVVRAESYAPPLLGRSWLTKIRLDWSTLFSPPISQVSVDQDNDVRVERLKEQYREIFKPELGTVKGVKAKLYLKENAKSVFQRARPVPYALRPAVEEELKRMESDGVLKPIEVSDWATPIVCVPKTDGSVRICGDYKGTVNPAIQTEQFPIPTLEEIRGKVSTWNKFTKIDLRSAYQQLVLDEESQKLCTINTHKGLFRYTRLLFGISSSPAIWQRFIEQVLTGLSGTCVIMDDQLVGGTNDDEHLKNLEAVFKQFLKFGLRVKLAKCVFTAPSVIYFGLHFSEKGLQPTDEKVQAIKEAPSPRNVTELRSFLGMLAALTNFIPKLSTLAHPLYQLLGNKPWNWTPACKQAFRDVKHALTSESVLAHYSPTLPMELSVDASPYGVGAVIMHVYPNRLRRPIAFASRTLNEHEKRYGQIDKEALAIMFGLKRFHLYLYGRHFTILTDHKPLERIFGPKTAIPSLAAMRLQRWAIILSAFDYSIRFVPSKHNAVADALSRLPLPSTLSGENAIFKVEERLVDSLPITHKEISHATQVDPVLSKVLEFVRHGWPQPVEDIRLKPYFNRRFELSVEQGCLLWGSRVIIAYRYQADMLEELHMGHPGIVRMKELARSYLWWPSVDIQIEQMVRNCASCQQPRNTSAGATISILRELFAKNGLPVQCVSDNGPQFRSEDFARFLRLNGVKHVRVAPYHAASNGLAERMVQSFKAHMKTCKGSKLSVPQRIANFLLTYRSTRHPTTGSTPAKLFLGRELRTRLTLLRPNTGEKVMDSQAKQKATHDVHAKFREFYPGDRILIRDLRKENTWWPGSVAERSGPKCYIVVLNDGRVWKRHLDHLRRDSMDSAVSQPEDER
ncbi:Transposon Tf2-6 polyprotein [Acropora cervicornis]|uniref:Transposon Tf2-6 polyprotein n=1 Tax=Acropora cervicornis TaxID=6130 RepID=A0AAD9VAB5_ACRCE|nr:Transposon Tf2-6 polyprotein [Acropora cervicornis]